MTAPTPYYKMILTQEFARRSEKNPRYSLRALAKALGIGAGALSQILSGKRVPSYKMTQTILSNLGLPPDISEKFLKSVAGGHQSRGLERLNPLLKKISNQKYPKDLSIDMFRIMGDWHHYAILMMTYIEHFNSNPKWIASQLDITEMETKLAIDRLLECGLLKRETGRLVSWDNHFTTADKHVTSAALKRHQRQILEKAIYSLENDPISHRAHTSMTMAIDPKKINEAKKLIEVFTNKLSGMLESGTRSHVYELSLCLFPIQKLKLKTKNKETL